MDSYFTHELGWANLNNTAARLTVAGADIDLIGVSDAHRDWDRLDALPDALAALGPRADAAALLGVTHAPYQRVLNAYVELEEAKGHTREETLSSAQFEIVFTRQRDD